MNPVFEKDLANRMRWQLSFRFVFILVTGFTTFLMRGSYAENFTSVLYGTLAIGALVTLISWPFLSRLPRDRWRVFAWFQVMVDLALTTTLVAMTGGIASSFLILFALQILMGALVLTAKGAVNVALIVSAVLVTLALQSESPIHGGEITRLLFIVSIFLFLGGSLAHLFRSKEKLEENLSNVEKSLEGLENLHQAIVENIPSGIAYIGSDERIRYLNPTAIQILECNDQGKSIHESLLKDFSFDSPRAESEISINGHLKRIGFQRKALADQGTLIVFQDVTEIRTLENKMQLNEKLAGIGRLAAGIAHEIRNPLASLSGSVQLLRDEVAMPQAPQKLIQIVLRETDRLDVLLQEFLDYARPSSLNLKEVNMAELVNDIFTLCRNHPEFSGKSIQLISTLPTSFIVTCDAYQMKQVIWNLIKNALQAVDRDGTIRVSGEKYQDKTRLEVSDSGSGIPEEIRGRVFDPFFSTKNNGTGLGLPLVFQMITAHRGQMGFESQVGRGTKFWIEVPHLSLATSEVA